MDRELKGDFLAKKELQSIYKADGEGNDQHGRKYCQRKKVVYKMTQPGPRSIVQAKGKEWHFNWGGGSMAGDEKGWITAVGEEAISISSFFFCSTRHDTGPPRYFFRSGKSLMETRMYPAQRSSRHGGRELLEKEVEAEC